MAHNTLYPAHVEIEYSSAYAPHTMTIPTVPVVDVSGVLKFDLRSPSIPYTWTDAIDDFIEEIKIYFPASVTFQNATLFTWDAPDGTASPIAGYQIGVVGTGVPTTGVEIKATQRTFSFRTDEFGIFKLIMLDCLATTYERISDPASSSVVGLVAYVTAQPSFLAGRDGGAPTQFLQMATAHNKRLRRSYRMN